MERVAIFASIGLALVLIRTWIVVERAETELRHSHGQSDYHGKHESVIYRAEWTDTLGILRSVETRGDLNEPTAATLARHRADLDSLASIYPPR